MPKKTIESLEIELSADVASLKRDMAKANRTVKKSTDGMARSARLAAKSIAAIGAGFAVGATVRKIIEATKKQEQAVAQLEAGLASTGSVVGQSLDELKKKAIELQKVTTFGDEEFIEAQAQLLSFTSIVGDEFDKTLELAADLSTRFGTDLKSSVIQLGKALNDPVANLSALSRSGIQFNKSQKEMIKLLVKSGNLVSAQTIILGELETQFGGSARAARDTFGGAIEGLGNAFDDLFEASSGLDEAKEEVEALTEALQDPKTVIAINAITSALISATTKYINYVKTNSSFLPKLILQAADKVSGVDEVFFGTAESIKKLNDEIASLDAQLSRPGGSEESKNAIALKLEQLRKERELFQAFLPEQEPEKTKPTLKPLTGLVGDDPQEAARKAKLKADAEKEAAAFAKQQQREADAIRNAIKSAQPAQKTYNDNVAAAQALLKAGKLEQYEYNDILAVYKQRLDDATDANAELYKDEELAQQFRENAITQTEKLNKELAEAQRLYSQGDLTGEVFTRTKDRIEKDLEDIKEAQKEVNEVGEAIAQGMQDVVADGFVSIWKGGFDDVLAGFGDLLINLAAEAAAADFLNAIGFGGKDNKGGNLSNLFGSLFSFDGGGYTGAGSRTGGLDGRGGFLSVLHPNETVVDHTKGQAVGGTTNININYSGTGNRAEDRRAAGAFARDLNNRLDSGRRYS